MENSWKENVKLYGRMHDTLIPVLLAAGLTNAINVICGPDMLGLYTQDSNTYVLLHFIYQAGFYFMPILIGYNGAKIWVQNQC